MSSEAVLRVWELLGWILVCLVLGWEDARLDILLSGLPSSPHGVTLAYLVENGEELPRYVTSVAARDKDNPLHNQVKNTMKDDSGAFSINGTTGDIFLTGR